MQYVVFDDMNLCTAAEVARMLPMASEQRRAQALRYSHVFGQFCCLKSYEMLLTLLKEWSKEQKTQERSGGYILREMGREQTSQEWSGGYILREMGREQTSQEWSGEYISQERGGGHIDASGGEFVYNEYGKPFLAGGPYFSISHCRHAIAVAIDSQPIGIDVESVRPLRQELVAKTMNSSEQALIAASEHPNRTFTALWTQKEALLKMRGTGIISDLRSVLQNTEGASLQTIDNLHKDYVLTICLRALRDTPLF